MKILKRKKAFFILIAILSIFIFVSCKDKVKVKGVEAGEDYNNLNTFLRSLPRAQIEKAQSPYNEMTTFLKGRDEIAAGKYKEGFETLARFLYTYPSSYYESEATYLLGEAVIYMVKSNPGYISEFYSKLNKEGIVEGESDEKDMQPENFSLKEIYNKLGIRESEGSYYFNGAPFSRIVRDTENTFPLKDFAYYFSIENRFSVIESPEDKEAFITNVRLISQFSDRYRTSVLQEAILNNKSYFPSTLPFSLTVKEKKSYDDTIRTVENRIEDIRPETEKSVYVIGNGIIVRDRIPAISTNTEKELYKLYNYDFVTILKETNVYNRKARENENWVLVRYDTYYGPIIGWSYAQYMTNDSSNNDVFSNYKIAMTSYNNYDYLKASDFFSYILSYPETNYFTDKSAYFLWKVNNKIGELVSSKDSTYYKYVLSYPKYFYYNTNSSVLQSSTLLYNYLIKIMPESPYRFVISSDSDTEYNVD